MYELLTDTLVDEYETLVVELGEDSTDDRLISALIAHHSWTEEGARVIVFLAREYGTAILRNAVALAAALKIEDGSSRF